ncbi:MAG: ribonuclease Z [Vicingaceae bacterium]
MSTFFQLLILGSGSAIPKKSKNHTAQLVIHKNVHLLVDCGEACQIRLRESGISVQRIDYIFISHLHGDHYLGLPGLISSMNLLGRERDLTIIGPPMIKKVIDLHFSLSKSASAFRIHYTFTQNKSREKVLEKDDLSVYSFPLKHKIPTTGFHFVSIPTLRKLIPEKLEEYNVPKHLRKGIAKGLDYESPMGKILNNELTRDPGPVRSYAYCADTAYFPEIVDWIINSDLIYHESSFLEADAEKAAATRHSTAIQAAKIAHASQAGKLLIGHFSSKYNDDEAFIREAKSNFQHVEVAVEGQWYEIP